MRSGYGDKAGSPRRNPKREAMRQRTFASVIRVPSGCTSGHWRNRDSLRIVLLLRSGQHLLEQRSRWLNSEPLTQEVKLAVVLLSQLVARVNHHLNLEAKAPHRSLIHAPRPAKPSPG